MPNGGGPEFVAQLPQLESFFSKIATVLETFAQKHNLKLEKYYHDFPAWSFLFRHPLAGLGHIQVTKKGDEAVTIAGMWWVDDHRTMTRASKDTITENVPADPIDLAEALEESLHQILSWPLGQWDETGSPLSRMPPPWHRFERLFMWVDEHTYPKAR